MKNGFLIRVSGVFSWFLLSAGWLPAGAEEVAPAPGKDPRWSVAAGPLFRVFNGGGFRSGSRSQTVPIPQGARFDRVSTGGAGPDSGEAPRTYSDGFVGPDTAGTTSGSLFENTTSRFGYQNDAQNNGDRTLSFQAPLTGAQALSSSGSSFRDLVWEEEPDREAGAMLELSRRITPEDRPLTVHATFAFLYSPFAIQGGGSTFSAERTDTRREITGFLTDTYGVPTGVVLPLAPYSQPDADPPPGFYPRIQDEPVRSLAPERRTVDVDRISWVNRIEEKVEADVFTFSLGPEIQLDVTDRLFLSAAAGAALHVVDWRASHRETLYRRENGGPPETVREWNDRAKNTDLVWGGFGQVSGGLLLGTGQEPARVFLQAFARWDFAEDLDGSVGPSRFTLDLDAFSAGAMAGFQF